MKWRILSAECSQTLYVRNRKTPDTSHALLEYHEARQAVALLQIEARRIADDLEGLAKLLRGEPERIDNPDGKLPACKQIFDLAAKMKKPLPDLAERQHTAQQFGCDV